MRKTMRGCKLKLNRFGLHSWRNNTELRRQRDLLIRRRHDWLKKPDMQKRLDRLKRHGTLQKPQLLLRLHDWQKKHAWLRKLTTKQSRLDWLKRHV